MESTEPKTFRSKSLNSQRVSIRRKGSFNKVRLLFENVNSNETKRYSDTFLKNKSLKQLEIQSNFDSLKVIEENVKQTEIIGPKVEHSFQIDDQEIHDLKDSSIVKNLKIFFENKSNDKIIAKIADNGIDQKPIKNVTKNSKFSNNFLKNYGNSDKTEESNDFNDDCNKDKKSEDFMTSTEEIDFELKNKESSVISNNGLHKKVISHQLPNSEPFVSPFKSDFVSFDSEVIFRTPNIKTEETIVKTKPIPKQRTSLIKTKDQNEVNNCLTSDERISGQSQDSGVSVIAHNRSFLWHQNSVIKDNSNIEENNSHLVPEKQQTEQIYEHIYEELSNCLSLSSNEWIDIEKDDKNKVIKHSDLLLNRKSLNFRSINNYRKSFGPKLHKRKSNKTNISLIKSSDESVDSGSATEYEDIDDDQDYELTINSVDSLKSNEMIEKTNKTFDELNNQHIYELTSDQKVVQLRNYRQTDPSNKLINKDEQDTQTPVHSNKASAIECEPNIYTSTPRRLQTLQTLESNSNENRSKRDSMISRNSSIYINPNCCRMDYPFNTNLEFGSNNYSNQIKSNVFETQLSINPSIASYLELSNSGQDHYSPFTSEPLYQFYQKDIRRRAQLLIHFDENLTDSAYYEYENNTIYGTTTCDHSNGLSATKSVDQIHTLCKRNLSTMDLVGNGPNRSLWCQLPQVINSKDNILCSLSDKQKRFQESMFEIITSEASYCKSLNILVSHFYNCIEFSENNSQILSKREKNSLFSNIVDISKISSNLLRALEKRFEQNLLLYDVCDIVYDYAVNHFQPYIHYCAYQRDQEKLLTKLTQSRSAFVDILQRLESNQICQNQSLLSFLMLPMQRITRYPLLIDAICQQLPTESPILDSVRKALGCVNQLVKKCNEETKKVQRMQELIEIEKILHFRSKMKSYPIVSGARYLVKKGSVVKLSPQLSARRTLGKSTLKWTKSSIHLFLFSDLLIMAKKKSENNYSVFDYCSRNTIQLIPLTNKDEEEASLFVNLKKLIPKNVCHLVQIILLHNHESKTVEYTISFGLESEKLRWIEAISQPLSENPNEVIYEEWDCPQVQCIKSYCAQQTDEINLKETDVLNVFRKIKDGWFEGQRIRDGVRGWFPSNYTEEIINQHVRARNIKMRHRLLMYTHSVIEEQKKTMK